MVDKKLPETDGERVSIFRAAIEQEEKNQVWDKVLSLAELEELRHFAITFENADLILKQAIIDCDKAKVQYIDLFKNVQMYVSHFIQVLLLTVIRNEIKPESLVLYDLREQEKNPSLPDLSTEEAVLKWSEKLMRGESERINRGGIPLYNPPIAKVKVHYELLKESIYSITIYEKNVLRLQNKMRDLRNKADEYIWDIWTKVEERYSHTSPDEQSLRFNTYQIQFHADKETI